MKKMLLLLYIFSIFICSKNLAQANDQQWNDRDLVLFNNRIGWQIFMGLTNSEEGNVCVSPYALTSTLFQVYTNCTEEQRDNLKKALDLYPDNESLLKCYRKIRRSFEIPMTTSIFFQNKTILPQGFASFLKKEFDEYPQFADFKNTRNAQAAINRVTSKKINTLDEDFFPRKNNPFEKINAPLLVNAASFYAEWGAFAGNSNVRFEREKESNGKRRNSIKMITGRGRMSLQEFDEFKVLISVNGTILSGIILPNKGIPLDSILVKMNSNTIEDLCSRSAFTFVEATVPEIKIHFRTSLKNIICDLGATSLFEINDNNTNLFTFSDFIVYYTNQYSTPQKIRGEPVTNSKSVLVNRPFIYFTMEYNTKLLLFLGRFHPTEND